MWFDIHVHTNHSDGSNSVEEVLSHAKKIGLDGLVITDHDVIEGSLKAVKIEKDLIVYPGLEVSSAEGHILGLNVSEAVPRDLSAAETVDRIHDAGGIAVAAHPYDLYRRGVGDLIFDVDFDAVEIFNGHTFGNKRNPQKQAEKAGRSMVGGSDAHTLGELGGITINVEGQLIESIKAGRLQIKRKNPYLLFAHHARGLAKRKFKKHVCLRFSRN